MSKKMSSQVPENELRGLLYGVCDMREAPVRSCACMNPAFKSFPAAAFIRPLLARPGMPQDDLRRVILRALSESDAELRMYVIKDRLLSPRGRVCGKVCGSWSNGAELGIE